MKCYHSKRVWSEGGRTLPLGSSDEETGFRLVIDRLAQQAFIANPTQVEQMLASQWPQVVVSPQATELTAESLKQLWRAFWKKQPCPPEVKLRRKCKMMQRKLQHSPNGWME
jgi:hypothetical protein